MLVLSRRVGERIVLPEAGVSIVVFDVRGKRVRIGIDAPSSASIHRQEVWERISNCPEPGADVTPDKSDRELPVA